MTAETLKPFITPQNVESFPTVHSSVAATKQQGQRRLNLLAIGISIITLVLLAFFSGYTIWLSTRISNSETEVLRLNRVIDTLQKHLGIDYLEQMHEFEEKYKHTIIDDPNTLDYIETDYDDEDDDDDDDDDLDDKSSSTSELSKIDVTNEEDINYDEQIAEYLKKFNNYDEDELEDDEDTDAVTGDSLYNDFEKYNGSKSKDEKPRMTRSIADGPHEAKHSARFNKSKQAELDEVEIIELQASSTKRPLQKLRNVDSHDASFVRAHSMESTHRSPLRHRSHRRRKFPVPKKSGESLFSAKSAAQLRSTNNAAVTLELRPAAHFHLHQKVPGHHVNTGTSGFNGDVYIAHHPSWSNEVSSEHYFTVNNGILTVREPGLYYVYAQVCYNNTYDQNGFVVFHNHNPILQCLNTVPTNREKLHTCHTSGLVYLRENESIHLRDFHADRNVVLKNSNNRSYFGLMKV